MELLATTKRLPAGVMVIPLLLGCTMNTFFPSILTIGGFIMGLFKNGVPTLINLSLFCSGATISAKMAGTTVRRDVMLTAFKFFIGLGLGPLLNILFGEVGFLGLAPLAMIGAVTNPNGVIYVILAGEYGDGTNVGATPILALNGGPFFTIVAPGASGMGDFPVTDIIVSITLMVVEFIIDNLDRDWRKVLAADMVLLPPLNDFALGAGMDFRNIVNAGTSGIILGLLTVLVTGLLSFSIYSVLRRKVDPTGVAIGTTTGVAITAPTAVAMAGPSFQSQIEIVVIQAAATVAIAAVFCPFSVSWLAEFPKKWDVARGVMETDVALDPLLEEAGINIEEQRREV